jgi:hypothetical protein
MHPRPDAPARTAGRAEGVSRTRAGRADTAPSSFTDRTMRSGPSPPGRDGPAWWTGVPPVISKRDQRDAGPTDRSGTDRRAREEPRLVGRAMPAVPVVTDGARCPPYRNPTTHLGPDPGPPRRPDGWDRTGVPPVASDQRSARRRSHRSPFTVLPIDPTPSAGQGSIRTARGGRRARQGLARGGEGRVCPFRSRRGRRDAVGNRTKLVLPSLARRATRPVGSPVADPAGRFCLVVVAPGSPGAIRLRFRCGWAWPAGGPPPR